MMLHRHFGGEAVSENVTKLADVSNDDRRESVSDIPSGEQAELPKQRGRKKKSED